MSVPAKITWYVDQNLVLSGGLGNKVVNAIRYTDGMRVIILPSGLTVVCDIISFRSAENLVIQWCMLLLLDPCHLIFRSIVSAFVYTLPV